MTVNNKGFTIIEVVITIAIGAAVMALVLNAVAGARRSQRNNARSADVNQMAAAVNQYIAARNALPFSWDQLKNIVGSNKLGHYNDASINPAASWVANIPNSAGTFPPIGGSACSDPSKTTQATCTGKWDHDGVSTTMEIDRDWTPSITPTHATTGSGFIGTPGNGNAADMVVILRQAGCNGTTAAEAGGIREMAIVYRLEGQSQISCLEV